MKGVIEFYSLSGTSGTFIFWKGKWGKERRGDESMERTLQANIFLSSLIPHPSL
jgi:hypothetical protein